MTLQSRNSINNLTDTYLGGHIDGVAAPPYLSVPGFENCLKEYNPDGQSHSQRCIPKKKPNSCSENSWKKLQDVFEGDCPHIGIGADAVAPPYLSVSGFEYCLEEYNPDGQSHSERCLPQSKPNNCSENSWKKLQNVFEGDCPSKNVNGGKI